ncbi:F0F1 ATP synthase subunit alpha [Culicoidibacter larvae]|uniref:ATP synthase subunit alpha n=1 Tax=Culicoidibacter larvae TaxID=2579976 RepID=A0A5R8QH84_9FIRM|nr:F0F1 ATP synthase subunit alpha [Culicoidibacter larvae]TLG77096.1 F0F1 ATP synthase subunit alpha [Culicoidibacter larvae]
MKLQADELTTALTKQLKEYDKVVNQYEVGHVMTIGDGIAITDGLDNVVSGELVAFGQGSFGMALNLEAHNVGVVLLEESGDISEGTEVRRTGRVVEVPVGDMMLGRVVDPLGKAIDGGEPIKSDKYRPVERVAPGVMARKSVDTPLQTGIKAIDSMIPIGRGQRELIIGDRQTGKTSIAIDTILNQKDQDVYCVYVAIGQKNSSVAKVFSQLKKAGAMDYTVIVSAGASELAPLQYIAPYSGCAIAEEWMSQGKDVLIIYDDLTKHAVAYRAISLLLRRPPGREAYPGDVFYLHSRLLERSAHMNDEFGGGSITALPIVETQAGDISAYIPTNVISITDGQIFLQTDLFNSGQRPAIDTGLSVSRVGGDAQRSIIKKLSGSMRTELAQFFELQSFSQFASSVDAYTRAVLDRGQKLLEVIKQPVNEPLTMEEQAVFLYAVQNKYIDKVAVRDIQRYQTELLSFMHVQKQDVLDKVRNNPTLSDENVAAISAALDAFKNVFSASERD